jgi:DNA-binding Xre family transcriptional regulator
MAKMFLDVIQGNIPGNIWLLFVIVFILFSLPQMTTMQDYRKFMRSMDTCKTVLSERRLIKKTEAYVEVREQVIYRAMDSNKQAFEVKIDDVNLKVLEIQDDVETVKSESITEIMNTAEKQDENIKNLDVKVIAIERQLNIPKKGRENYGVIRLSLLINMVKKRARYDSKLLIDMSDSIENRAKINALANEINCNPENITKVREEFKNIGTLYLSAETNKRYLEIIMNSLEYKANENFKKEVDYLYKKIRNKISNNRN